MQVHTFLIADLAGFTALTEAHGDEAAADAAESFIASMRELLPAHKGREVKTMGDAVLVHLDDARRGLDLAISAVCELGSRHGALGVRVGVNTGPAVRRGEDWFGMTINVTARIAVLARVDGVLLTEATRQHALRVGDHALREWGPRLLRNVRTPVVLHELLLPEPRRSTELDVVCRMAVGADALLIQHAGTTLRFCSRRCAETFKAAPHVYVGATSG